MGELCNSEVMQVALSASCWKMNAAASALALRPVTNGPVLRCVHRTQAGRLLISQAQITALFAAWFRSQPLSCGGTCVMEVSAL